MIFFEANQNKIWFTCMAYAEDHYKALQCKRSLNNIENSEGNLFFYIKKEKYSKAENVFGHFDGWLCSLNS